jgi:predicted phage replisome organizer
MAKYDKDTKFYWLQLKEDFFEDDAIEWLEEQKPNGRDYAYFYLKLCLKSLKSNGVLVRKVGKILIPYDNQKLAELTKMDFDTVTVAMELLKKIGLIQILDNGEIYINQLENLIGSKSIGAFKKQQQRLLSGQKEDKCPPKIELELEEEDIPSSNDEEMKKHFELIWEIYPNKKGRAKAEGYFFGWLKGRKINKSIKRLTDEQMYYAVRKYAKECEDNKIEQQYIKHGDTFFNSYILDYVE